MVFNRIIVKTRMHSSRMRTGRSLTVFRGGLLGRGVSLAGGLLARGGLLAKSWYWQGGSPWQGEHPSMH